MAGKPCAICGKTASSFTALCEEHWKRIPEETREAFVKAMREMQKAWFVDWGGDDAMEEAVRDMLFTEATDLWVRCKEEASR
jgi:hypothetical protein